MRSIYIPIYNVFARRIYLLAVHLLSDLPKMMKKSANTVTAKLRAPTQIKVFCWPMLVIQGWMPQVMPKPTRFLIRMIVVTTCVSSNG